MNVITNYYIYPAIIIILYSELKASLVPPSSSIHLDKFLIWTEWWYTQICCKNDGESNCSCFLCSYCSFLCSWEDTVKPVFRLILYIALHCMAMCNHDVFINLHHRHIVDWPNSNHTWTADCYIIKVLHAISIQTLMVHSSISIDAAQVVFGITRYSYHPD